MLNIKRVEVGNSEEIEVLPILGRSILSSVL